MLQPAWYGYAKSLQGLPMRVPNGWWGPKHNDGGFSDCRIDDIVETEKDGRYFEFHWGGDPFYMTYDAVATYVDKKAAKEKGIAIKPPKEIPDLMKPPRNKKSSVVRT